MIKILINKGNTNITLDFDTVKDLTEVIPQIPVLIKNAFGEELPFETDVKVKEITPQTENGETLSEEDLDIIEKSKAKGAQTRKEAENELAKAEEERIAALAKKNEDIRLAEKARAEEKEKAIAEKVERDARTKARKIRKLDRMKAEIEETMSKEDMDAEAEIDARDEATDKAAEQEFQEKYGEVPATEKVPTVEKPTTAPKVEKTVKTTETTKVEEVTKAPAEVEEELPGKNATEKGTIIFQNQIKNQSPITQAIDSVKKLFENDGLSPVDLAIYIIDEFKVKEKVWNMMIKRPEQLAEKFRLSKEDAAKVIKGLQTK